MQRFIVVRGKTLPLSAEKYMTIQAYLEPVTGRENTYRLDPSLEALFVLAAKEEN